MLTLNRISALNIALTLSLIMDIDGNRTNNHVTKSDIENNFEVLLNLYKINPLRQSKVYKQFSNRMLLPNRVDHPFVVLHFDSNESTRERQARTNVNLKRIEEAIHMTQPRHRYIGPPSYTIHDIVPEKFNSESVAFDISRLQKVKSKKSTEVFDNILEHIPIESNEMPHKVQSDVDFLAVTKTKPFIDVNRVDRNNSEIIGKRNKVTTLPNENSNKIFSTEEVVIMR